MNAQPSAHHSLAPLWFALAALLLALVLPTAAAAGPVAPSVAISEAGGNSMAIKSDGTLWVWGGNPNGQLGTNDTLPRFIPAPAIDPGPWKAVSMGGDFSYGIKTDGTLWVWGRYGIVKPPERFGTDSDWKAIAAGDMHVLALKDNGSLWAWGGNEWGMLGQGTHGGGAGSNVPLQVGSATWKSIGAGYGDSVAVRTDGTLWAWGRNSSGELGLNDTTDRYVPWRVGTATNWAAVAGGWVSNLALRTDGTLWAWGDNQSGQLGLGDTSARDKPVRVGTATDWKTAAIGSSHSAAIKTDGTLWTWGTESVGELGIPSLEMGVHPAPIKVGTVTTWAAVACGNYYTLAITTSDQFAACGSNLLGELGLGYPAYRCTPEQIGTVGGWAMVDAGTGHSAGVRDDGTLWTWGRNSAGELGLGNPDTPPARAPVQVGADGDWQSVSCGENASYGFTLAVKQGGTLWAWGENASGQLGLGDTADRGSPSQVGTDSDWAAVACSDGLGDMVGLQGVTFTLNDHVLALKKDGSLWAWGSDSFGQLGLGPAAVGSTVSTPTRVGSDYDWAAIACGDDYCVAIKTGGTLWTWGRNLTGQLGLGDTTGRSSPTEVAGADWKAVACGSGRDDNHTVAVKTDGSLWAWGGDQAGELGFATPGLVPQLTPR